MRLVTTTPWMILIFTISHTPISPLFPILLLSAQSPPQLSPRALDSLLQSYAFRSFPRRPITGIPYSGHVPGNFSGVEVSALRLRTGRLRTRGFDSFKEFSISAGLVEQPHVERLVLVYHNLGNLSSFYYPLPGYTYLAPILGLMAYDGSDLSAKIVPELDIRASENPITIKFHDLEVVPRDGLLKKCVFFDLHGSVEFNNVLDGNVCSATEQGHFSIVVEFTAPPSPPPGGGGVGGGGGYKKQNYSKLWIIVGSAIGGFVLVVLLGMSVTCLMNCRHRERVRRLEQAAEGSVPLRTTSVGRSKMPMATVTRTRPVLENKYEP